jgi:CysZ protein
VLMNGIDCFFEGLKLIRQPGLRRYVAIPLLINILVLSAAILYGVNQYDWWMTYVEDSLPEFLSFLGSIVAILGIIVGLAVLLYSFTIVANIIAAPFNALLSIKVEEQITGQTLTSDTGLHLIFVRSISREISKFLYYLPRLLGLLVISLIPGLNALAPFLWIAFGAWMMAVQYTDYAADNNEISFSELRTRLNSNTFQALMFGLPAYFLLAIPVINLVLIPAGVAGGTKFWVERLR